MANRSATSGFGFRENGTMLQEVEVGRPRDQVRVRGPGGQPKDEHVETIAGLGGELVHQAEGHEQGDGRRFVPAVVGDAGEFQVDPEAERDRVGTGEAAPGVHEEAETQPVSDARGKASTILHALEA